MPVSSTRKIVNKPLSHCEECGMGFKKLEHLQRHMRTHTQDRPYPCVFPTCGKAFARQDTLTRHARLHSREGGETAKIRTRRRTKSVSSRPTIPISPPISAASVSTSPPTHVSSLPARRQSEGSTMQPLVTTGFALQQGLPRRLSASANWANTSSSRLSSLDLLGTVTGGTMPQEMVSSSGSAAKPFIADMNQGYIPSSFTSWSPMAQSLFLGKTAPPAADHQVMDDRLLNAASPLSISDDGSSSSDVPSLLSSQVSSIPSSFISSPATSFSLPTQLSSVSAPKSKYTNGLNDFHFGQLADAHIGPLSPQTVPLGFIPTHPSSYFGQTALYSPVASSYPAFPLAERHPQPSPPLISAMQNSVAPSELHDDMVPNALGLSVNPVPVYGSTQQPFAQAFFDVDSDWLVSRFGGRSQSTTTYV